MTLLGIMFSQKIYMFANKETLKKKEYIERRPNYLKKKTQTGMVHRNNTNRNIWFITPGAFLE